MFKPLLAAKADLDLIRYPVLASPKIDGIRCVITPDGPVTRSLKPIPNDHIRNQLFDEADEGLDGELITLADDGSLDDFNAAQSKIMRKDGAPRFRFLVFDMVDNALPFHRRLILANRACGKGGVLLPVEHVVVANADALAEIEQLHVEQGYEGTMLRDPNGLYKFGRSTAKEGTLLKVKRFEDDEAVITGTIERMHNTNEATTNALGRTERSSAKAGLVGMDTLGALQCLWKGVAFDLGTGFDDAQRAALWAKRGSLAGKTVTFKYQGIGSGGAPRFPVFLRMREAE
jgi:DNA ligase 1